MVQQMEKNVKKLQEMAMQREAHGDLPGALRAAQAARKWMTVLETEETLVEAQQQQEGAGAGSVGKVREGHCTRLESWWWRWQVWRWVRWLRRCSSAGKCPSG